MEDMSYINDAWVENEIAKNKMVNGKPISEHPLYPFKSNRDEQLIGEQADEFEIQKLVKSRGKVWLQNQLNKY